LRRLQEACGPLCEDRGDLVVIFLGYKLIESCFGVEQNGFDRQLGAVVRVKVEFGWACVWKRESSKGTRDCGGGGSQTGLS
jgi:hypothetical protein